MFGKYAMIKMKRVSELNSACIFQTKHESNRNLGMEMQARYKNIININIM